MNVPFETEEFVIDFDDITQAIATKIWKWHIIPMLVVRHMLGVPITASEQSGYRSPQHEWSKGRSGKGEHTFYEGSKGAVDWTTQPDKLQELFELMLLHTNYTRIAVYKTFIHADYKAKDGYRYIFDSTPDSKWTLRHKIKIQDHV